MDPNTFFGCVRSIITIKFWGLYKYIYLLRRWAVDHWCVYIYIHIYIYILFTINYLWSHMIFPIPTLDSISFTTISIPQASSGPVPAQCPPAPSSLGRRGLAICSLLGGGLWPVIPSKKNGFHYEIWENYNDLTVREIITKWPQFRLVTSEIFKFTQMRYYDHFEWMVIQIYSVQ